MKPIGAVLLAAGASERFGATDKLLAEIDGMALSARVASRLRQAGVTEVAAVVRDGSGPVARALAPHVTRLVVNSEARRGMGVSIARGVAALAADCAGALIVPGDMPGLSVSLLTRILSAFEEAGGERIVYPVLAGVEQRNPVLWPRRFLAELASLDGPGGAKQLLQLHAGETMVVAVEHDWEVADIDTAADLAAWHGTVLPPGRSMT